MAVSQEAEQLLRIIFVFGIGVCGIGFVFLLAILYFAVTRKYDAIFPEHHRLSTAGTSIWGNIHRSGAYAKFIVFKNTSKHAQHVREITRGYDFRKNATLTDIILSYLTIILGFLFLTSLFVFFILKKIFGLEL